jgi:hypothetical protein
MHLCFYYKDSSDKAGCTHVTKTIYWDELSSSVLLGNWIYLFASLIQFAIPLLSVKYGSFVQNNKEQK